MAGENDTGNKSQHGTENVGPRANRRKTVEGVVVSDKMDKTITVVVERLGMHPRYKKYVRSSTRMKAHDAEGSARVGDIVRISQTRPLSKTKRWRLLEVLRKAD